ncbi:MULTISPECIES: fumarate hydratase [unclassified Sphingobium]|uniref:fumarate hydratase n=1 Tax=unclassified Sphingobium TaxID=2611147 RepID=UPI002224A9B4|nr:MULTISPECIES: fumarate hydratase [unclassified Sphingobium]MCW2382992.1 fumarate hydratase subunit alpha [Sphingobium sp. B2D3B]MCW2400032.1 fumarate hydratase subunit alpha [Sphingobium sp. B2D3C]
MITEDLVQEISESLYSAALRRVPPDTIQALEAAREHEAQESARATLDLMVRSARLAEARDTFVCSDSGVPTYCVEIGGAAQWQGDLKAAITRGFDHLVETISPPLLKHVNNPLTNERGGPGKDMPAITVDLLGNADYIDITCVPKALGSGRWASLRTLISPSLEDIEACVLDAIIEAGSQHCPPVVVGVGIGGNFDLTAKLANRATYREIGSLNPNPTLAAMEERLTEAANATGFGPMGVGGSTTALAVHIDYAFGHGYTPVAVCFNCWINRRAKARLHSDGRVERLF